MADTPVAADEIYSVNVDRMLYYKTIVTKQSDRNGQPSMCAYDHEGKVVPGVRIVAKPFPIKCIDGRDSMVPSNVEEMRTIARAAHIDQCARDTEDQYTTLFSMVHNAMKNGKMHAEIPVILDDKFEDVKTAFKDAMLRIGCKVKDGIGSKGNRIVFVSWGDDASTASAEEATFSPIMPDEETEKIISNARARNNLRELIAHDGIESGDYRLFRAIDLTIVDHQTKTTLIVEAQSALGRRDDEGNPCVQQHAQYYERITGVKNLQFKIEPHDKILECVNLIMTWGNRTPTVAPVVAPAPAAEPVAEPAAEPTVVPVAEPAMSNGDLLRIVQDSFSGIIKKLDDQFDKTSNQHSGSVVKHSYMGSITNAPAVKKGLQLIKDMAEARYNIKADLKLFISLDNTGEDVLVARCTKI